MFDIMVSCECCGQERRLGGQSKPCGCEARRKKGEVCKKCLKCKFHCRCPVTTNFLVTKTQLDRWVQYVRDSGWEVEHTYAVRYHSTDVVEIHDDETWTLHAGGYYTVTTKSRINEYSPASISQCDFIWYLNGKKFEDDCRVDENGCVIEDLIEYHREIHCNKSCVGLLG